MVKIGFDLYFSVTKRMNSVGAEFEENTSRWESLYYHQNSFPTDHFPRYARFREPSTMPSLFHNSNHICRHLKTKIAPFSQWWFIFITIFGKEDISRFNVTMNQILAVDIIQSEWKLKYKFNLIWNKSFVFFWILVDFVKGYVT